MPKQKKETHKKQKDKKENKDYNLQQMDKNNYALYGNRVKIYFQSN